MADKAKAKETFNNVARKRGLVAAAVLAAGVASAPTDDIQTQYQVSLRLGASEHQQAAAPKSEFVTLPAADVPSLRDLWAQHGLQGDKINTALSTLSDEQQSNLLHRSPRMFAEEGFADVIRHMENGKQKKLNELVQKLADMPDGMRIITTTYTRIEKEQNDEVWREFQEKAEPAFYRYMAAHHETALRDAGFCDYAIDCMRRGVGPTSKDGFGYNVDIDHLTERAGGGDMCREKSVDPVTGGEPLYPINHISNLCLIMRDVHVQVKNEINALQSIAEISLGESRRIIMAVPEDNRRLLMIQPENLRAEKAPPADTSYFAMGPSIQIIGQLERFQQTFVNIGPEAGAEYYKSNIAPEFNHMVKLWNALADSLDQAKEDGSLRARDVNRTATNCDACLPRLQKIMSDTHMPQEALEKLGDISKRIYAHLKPEESGTAPAARKPEGKVHANV